MPSKSRPKKHTRNSGYSRRRLSGIIKKEQYNQLYSLKPSSLRTAKLAKNIAPIHRAPLGTPFGLVVTATPTAKTKGRRYNRQLDLTHR